MAGFNIKHWFADGAFRTIIRNSAWLGSSNVVSALLGLLALSCAGKGMTPAMFGVLVIVQSYAKSISDFIKYQIQHSGVAWECFSQGSANHRGQTPP